MDKKLKFGVVGLGARGSGLLNMLMRVEKAEIVAVCDTYEDRVDKAIERIREERNVTAAGYTDYTKMLEDESVEAVLIVSSWDEHIRMAIQSMRAGKITACEVGGAYDVEE